MAPHAPRFYPGVLEAAIFELFLELRRAERALVVRRTPVGVGLINYARRRFGVLLLEHALAQEAQHMISPLAVGAGSLQDHVGRL